VTASATEAIKWLVKAGESGDQQSQFMVGFLNDSSKSGTRNAPEAAKWYRKAADPGNTDAVTALGRFVFFRRRCAC
jgi:TPR repeat protein